MSYEVAMKSRRKTPVLVDLKWPESDKDGDPDDVPSLRTLRLRDRAPSSPAALAKAGQVCVYSADAPLRKRRSEAAKKSIGAGLRRKCALRAATLSPAEIFWSWRPARFD